MPDHTGPGVERQVSTDQANTSIAVDETWLVKWFTRPVRRSDLAVVDHLAEAGFVHMPIHVGAVTDDSGAVVAVVTEFVSGATDGWEWYVGDVIGWLDGPVGPQASSALDALDALVATAARMGAITADLHRTLATAGTSVASSAPLRVSIAERRQQALMHTAGGVGERLRARLGQIDAALATLDGIEEVTVQRVHGDLHAGQFLRSDDRLLLVDFDGDPMTASADRLAMQPVERDVAALLQSLDHVARVANQRRPEADVTEFADAAVAAAERAYRERHAVDDRLLWPLRVAQELHEYAYAALHLPVWAYVPDAAMQALFPQVDMTGSSTHPGATDV
jgi:maltokinase